MTLSFSGEKCGESHDVSGYLPVPSRWSGEDGACLAKVRYEIALVDSETGIWQVTFGVRCASGPCAGQSGGDTFASFKCTDYDFTGISGTDVTTVRFSDPSERELGFALSGQDVPAVCHHEYEWRVVAEPSGCDDGKEIYECIHCGDVSDSATIVSKEHEWVTGELYEATCDTPGYTEMTCVRCGCRDKTDYVPALGHLLEYVEASYPTCLEDGHEAGSRCTRDGCGYTEGLGPLPALGYHEYYDSECVSLDGASHKVTRICPYCGDVVELVEEHQMLSEWVAPTSDIREYRRYCQCCGYYESRPATFVYFVNEFTGYMNVDGIRGVIEKTHVVTGSDVPESAYPAYPSSVLPEQDGYRFSGWARSTRDNGDIVLTAIWERVWKSITWYDESGSEVLASMNGACESDIPDGYAQAPEKPSDAYSRYEFYRWNRTSDSLGNLSFFAEYSAFAIPPVTVYWLTGDSTYSEQAQPALVEAGAYEKVFGTPTRESDSRYRYEFAGWEREDKPNGNVVFTANWDAIEKPKVTVTWIDWNGRWDYEYYEDEVPEANLRPGGSKPSDGEYEYRFARWDKMVDDDGNVTYTAIYDAIPLPRVNVVWVDDDETPLYAMDGVLEKDVSDGLYGSVPVKPSDRDHDYAFSGWFLLERREDGTVVYKASYSSVPIAHLVQWIDWDGRELRSDSFTENDFPDPGTLPDPRRDSDYGYDYSFAGWSMTRMGNGDVTYTATYTRSERKRVDVYWIDDDGMPLADMSGVLAGDASDALYEGTVPSKPSDRDYDYEFSGWALVEDANGKRIYKAIYERIAKQKTATWKSWDGQVLYETGYVLDGKPDANGFPAPERMATSGYRYEFSGWDVSVDVNDNVTYTARYDEIARVYVNVYWLDALGDVIASIESVEREYVPAGDRYFGEVSPPKGSGCRLHLRVHRMERID